MDKQLAQSMPYMSQPAEVGIQNPMALYETIVGEAAHRPIHKRLPYVANEVMHALLNAWLPQDSEWTTPTPQGEPLWKRHYDFGDTPDNEWLHRPAKPQDRLWFNNRG